MTKIGLTGAPQNYANHDLSFTAQPVLRQPSIRGNFRHISNYDIENVWSEVTVESMKSLILIIVLTWPMFTMKSAPSEVAPW